MMSYGQTAIIVQTGQGYRQSKNQAKMVLILLTIDILLSMMYKLLERLIIQRIQPLIEAATPVHQAVFRKHRSFTEQVMALNTHIEIGFQRRLKTGVVFVDLSCVEAYEDRLLCENF
jgi:hypothetical protein